MFERTSKRRRQQQGEAEQRLVKELGDHVGLWVAVRDDHVVASDESFDELMTRVDRENVVVWQVPSVETLVL